MNQKDERTWGTFIHLGGIVGMMIIPGVGNIIGVLILWLIKRNESAFVDDQGKEAINFQITLSLISVLLGIIGFISFGLWSLGTFWSNRHDMFDFHWGWSWMGLHGILWILNLVFSIVGAVKASNGVSYRYPFSLRIVK
ncbi:DUF4870 domain-containing protein [Chitinophaga vietnamensis]|uniref:DUF4870 domain-containing protein n=1 Tax=Chitinophaga vietnamensis TaxID=2593957 RepID=UPI001178A4E1|nr:DUF4870 domain-containing protein [Chitinophaga vietnamensis]